MKTDKQYWNMIAQMGWASSDYNYKFIRSDIRTRWSNDEINELALWVGNQASNLYRAIDKWVLEHDIDLDVGSDDGLSDTLYHIIGLGESEYNAAINNPLLIEKRENAKYGSPDGYVESFMYCFLQPDEASIDQGMEEMKTHIGKLNTYKAYIDQCIVQTNSTNLVMPEAFEVYFKPTIVT